MTKTSTLLKFKHINSFLLLLDTNINKIISCSSQADFAEEKNIYYLFENGTPFYGMKILNYYKSKPTIATYNTQEQYVYSISGVTYYMNIN